MGRRGAGSRPTWSDVKAKVAGFDRASLLGLIQDLYAAHKDNQAFLHARLGLGEDVLAVYKETLDRWFRPDVYRNQNPSVAKAKQAISSYRKASGDPAGLAELMAYYCECAAGFCADFGYEDVGYLDALVRMFGECVAASEGLPDQDRKVLRERLDAVCTACHQFGYGVGDYMDSALATTTRPE